MISHDEKSLVTVASYWHVSEAWIAQNRLEAEGIRARVTNDLIVGMYWLYANATGGVKVLVAAADADRALTLLAENRLKKLPEIDHIKAMSDAKLCPSCGCPQMYKEKYWRRAVFFCWFVLGFPLPIHRRHWACWHCGYSDKLHLSQITIYGLLGIVFSWFFTSEGFIYSYKRGFQRFDQ